MKCNVCGYSIRYKDKVKAILNSSSFSGFEDYCFDPVILKGSGSVTVNEANTPNYTLQVDIKEDGYVQMPLIYYPGYKISVTDLTTNISYTVESINMDGLIAFELNQGTYEVTTSYVGTSKAIASKVVFAFSLSITSLALIYGVFLENCKYKKFIKKR